MAMSEARASRVRHDLHGRIATLASEGRRMRPAQLVEGVDAIRTLANSYGFLTVSSLAARLESALARDIGPSTLLSYLDALDDAVKLEPMRMQAQQALLASVALRLGQ